MTSASSTATRNYLYAVSSLFGTFGIVMLVSPAMMDGYLNTWGRLARLSTPFSNCMIQHTALESLSVAGMCLVFSRLPPKKILIQTTAIVAFVPAIAMSHGMIRTDFFNRHTAGLMAAVSSTIGITGLRIASLMNS